MNHGVDAVPLDRLGHGFRVADVAFHQRDVTDGGPVPGLQGVEYHDLAATVAQEAHRVRTDVAGATGHENCHPQSLSHRRPPERRVARIGLAIRHYSKISLRMDAPVLR